MAMEKLPKYRRHRASGQAAVVLGGVWHYLGAHGTPESRERYDRLVSQWLAGGRKRRVGPCDGLTVRAVLNAYLSHAEGLVSASQLDRIRRAARPAVELYGPTPAAGFRGRALKEVRSAYVSAGHNRRHCNQLTNCLKRAWRWALSEELVPADGAQSVLAVAALAPGESAAPEPGAVRPVPVAAVEATLPFLPPTVADMVRVQLYSATRPGEVCRLRGDELDRSMGGLWVWRPALHKTARLGHPRQVFLGPKAIGIVAERLDAAKGGYLFSPARDREARFAAMRAARKTPVQPSQQNRKKARPRKAPGERYLRTSYCHAVARGCKKAGVAPWHPLMLRHTAATLLVEAYGWEVARVYLGHRHVNTTRIYAAEDLAKVERAAREFG